MSTNPDIMRRLRKLLELAKRGEGGEQVNAERMLANTMAKHGVTMAQLESAEVTRYWFPTPTKADERLFNQVVFKVINTHDYKLWQRGRNSRRTGVDLTHAQHLEVDFLYTLYRRQLRKELERVQTAFIHKHRIFGDAKSPDAPARPMTHEEWLRLRAMMQGMDALPIHKQIGTDNTDEDNTDE